MYVYINRLTGYVLKFFTGSSSSESEHCCGDGVTVGQGVSGEGGERERREVDGEKLLFPESEGENEGSDWIVSDSEEVQLSLPREEGVKEEEEEEEEEDGKVVTESTWRRVGMITSLPQVRIVGNHSW